MATVSPGYEWLYVAGFVHPESGRISYWRLSGVDAPVFDLMLKAFAKEQGVGRRNASCSSWMERDCTGPLR